MFSPSYYFDFMNDVCAYWNWRYAYWWWENTGAEPDRRPELRLKRA